MKTFICESCRFSEEKLIEEIKPLWAFSSQTHKVKRINMYCKFKHKYILLIKTKCVEHKSKSGKVGKNLYQKQVTEY